MTNRKTTRTKLPRRRAVVIHGLDDAMRAVSTARELGVAIALWSAPDAAASMGPAWFRDIIDSVERSCPGMDVEGVLDCGDAAGHAMAALRAGVRIIHFSGPAATVSKIEDIAGNCGARLARRPKRLLDPRREQDSDLALRAWLRDSKTG